MTCPVIYTQILSALESAGQPSRGNKFRTCMRIVIHNTFTSTASLFSNQYRSDLHLKQLVVAATWCPLSLLSIDNTTLLGYAGCCMCRALGSWRSCQRSEAMGLHAVIIPYPLEGHNLPAVQLARKLAGYGIEVTFANVFECLAQEHFEILHSDSIRTVTLGLATDPGPGPLPYFKVVESLEGEAEKLLEKLSNENVASPPTCLISDIFLGWTQKVANKLNLPRYALCSAAANYLSAFLYTPTLAAQGKVPVEPSRAWEVVHDIPGVPPTHLIDLSSTVQAASRQNFEQFCERNAQPAQESVGVFINTFYELEPFCVDALRNYPYQSKRPTNGVNFISMLPVGPLLHDAYFRDYSTADTNPVKRAPYIQWLDKQPKSSVLYVSFGSVAVLSTPQIHELALGLEASKQRFLLVIRPPRSKDDRERCPLLPEIFKADIEGKGFVQIGWVSQLDVLSHSAVGGFLTHCGWNSSLESICRGVPMLAWPIQADQRLNCRFLVDVSKVAIEVHKGVDGVVAKEEVVRAVIQLMVEPKGEIIRTQVRRLREIVLKAVANSGSVQKSLERSVAELKVWSTIGPSPA